MKELILTAAALAMFCLVYLVLRRLDKLMAKNRKDKQKLKASKIVTGENDMDGW
ncbi:MAG: hypothetical protein IJD60_00740 [Clostridia bacterium]|nr:hypothetical protein [Clostridia bacterium]